MTTYKEVEVNFVLDDDFSEHTDEIEGLAADHDGEILGGGAGFGFRDLEFRMPADNVAAFESAVKEYASQFGDRQSFEVESHDEEDEDAEDEPSVRVSPEESERSSAEVSQRFEERYRKVMEAQKAAKKQKK